MLMYRDLDPSNWPHGKDPGSHQRIQEFFLGIQHHGMDTAPEYSIDDPNLRNQIPDLIYDADFPKENFSWAR